MSEERREPWVRGDETWRKTAPQRGLGKKLVSHWTGAQLVPHSIGARDEGLRGMTRLLEVVELGAK